MVSFFIDLGNFDKDVKEGFGVLSWKSNTSDFKIYLGFWSKGVQNGVGKFFSKKGPKYGYWVEGERIAWYNSEEECVSNIDSSLKEYEAYFKLSLKEVMDFLELSQ